MERLSASTGHDVCDEALALQMAEALVKNTSPGLPELVSIWAVGSPEQVYDPGKM
jgi:hypothetical protein